MQKLDERKRRAILKAASDHFVKRPYHEVRLDDIASAARVGKGTLYVYFDSKDHLFLEMVTERLDELLAELRLICTDSASDAWACLGQMVERLCDYTTRHPQMFEIMRSPAQIRAIRKRRAELGRLFRQVLIRGVECREFEDSDPALTAQFIPAMARAGVVWGDRSLTAQQLSRHILRVLEAGIRKGRR